MAYPLLINQHKSHRSLGPRACHGDDPSQSQVGAACLPNEIAPIKAPFDMPSFKKNQFPPFTVNIADNGAKENELATQVIQAAIDTVSNNGGGMVVIPRENG